MPKKSDNGSKNALAQASRSPSARAGNERITVRPIANGYVTTRAEVKRGKYVETETFSASRPRITTTVTKGG